MPIHKRNRNFQNIVSELDIQSVPTEYIQSLGLVCANGERINFKGDDLKKFPEGDLVSGLIHLVEDNSDLTSPVVDVEIVIDYAKLEKEVNEKTSQLLNDK
ncbi:MAG: hypothetical protein CMD92_08800 [Gammaproteobacteria bacterium]|nr:hypothetical protein [Gammaproteobacteria bacterium]|tara:strand:- start:488 stop:790 length:303 start_codon:yes stop_codon:yes gene_type:complete